MKHSNHDIKLALEGAHALSEMDLPFPTAMKLYDTIEILAPKGKAIEAERIKLIQKHGEEIDGGWRVPETVKDPEDPKAEISNPGWQAFQAAYMELLGTEQEVPELPQIQIGELGSADALKKLNVKAQLIGALRRIGVLVLDPPPATRAERRRKAKEKVRAS
jgi:hypothetical protein